MDGCVCIFCEEYTRIEKIQENPPAYGTPSEWIVLESDFDGKNDLCICPECREKFREALSKSELTVITENRSISTTESSFDQISVMFDFDQPLYDIMMDTAEKLGVNPFEIVKAGIINQANQVNSQ